MQLHVVIIQLALWAKEKLRPGPLQWTLGATNATAPRIRTPTPLMFATMPTVTRRSLVFHLRRLLVMLATTAMTSCMALLAPMSRDAHSTNALATTE